MAKSKSVREQEGWLVLEDGTRLFEKTWEPTSSPNAHLIFLHGFSDRSEVHYSLFPTLASPPYNISVHAIDQRGWGKSVHYPSQRGLTGPTSQVLLDIDAYITHVIINKIEHDRREQDPGRSQKSLDGRTSFEPPFFLMGHSMGGQVALHYLLSNRMTKQRRERRHDLAGIILEAPYVALHPSSQPWSLLVLAGKVAAMISPKSQMKQHLDSRFITHDDVVNQEWESDELCHGYGTLEGLRDMLRRGADLVALTNILSRARSQAEPEAEIKTAVSELGFDLSQSSIPMLWTHGTDDRITDFGSSKALFDALYRHQEQQQQQQKSKIDSQQMKTKFTSYEGAYHKIHAEPNGVGVRFARDVGDWILSVVDDEKQMMRNEHSQLNHDDGIGTVDAVGVVSAENSHSNSNSNSNSNRVEGNPSSDHRRSSEIYEGAKEEEERVKAKL